MREEEREARARVFGEIAELYERTRPSYPAQLVTDVLDAIPRGSTARLLEIGAGTGKATRLFAPSVAKLIALEPDPAMAAIARRRCARFTNVRVVVDDFEHWDPEGDRFDAIIAGQAWHWVDPALGYPKARRLLTADGILAAFWNVPIVERSRLAGAIDAAYREHAPSLHRKSSTTYASFDSLLEHHESFRVAIRRSYPWQQVYTAAEYGELIRTHSDHHILPTGDLEALVAAVRTVIDAAGGELVLDYDSVLGILVPGEE